MVKTFDISNFDYFILQNLLFKKVNVYDIDFKDIGIKKFKVCCISSFLVYKIIFKDLRFHGSRKVLGKFRIISTAYETSSCMGNPVRLGITL